MNHRVKAYRSEQLTCCGYQTERYQTLRALRRDHPATSTIVPVRCPQCKGEAPARYMRAA